MVRASRQVTWTLAVAFASVASVALAQGRGPWVDPPRVDPVQPEGAAGGSPPIARTPAAEPGAARTQALPAREAFPADPPPRRERAPEVRPAIAVVPPRLPERPQRVRPSFNCRSARTSVERSICADPVLSAKDLRMALLYEQAGGSRHGPVDPSQWRWRAHRNACARARGEALGACVEQAYDARIAELSTRRR